MAYTYNDVQNSKAAYTLGDASSETTDGGMDLETWTAAMQSAMPGGTDLASTLGTGSVLSAAQQGESHIRSVSEAAMRLSSAQSVANVHIMNDNFIRDSITGK